MHGRIKRAECPFCDSALTEIKSQQHYGLWHWIQCNGCGARGPRVDTRAAATMAWNAPNEPASAAFDVAGYLKSLGERRA